MVTAWRIVKKRYWSTAFDGEGARRYGGRWNSPGTRVVYLAESRALAALEVLVGIRSPGPLPAYVLASVRFDESLVETVSRSSLGSHWREIPPHRSTQRIGDDWTAGGRSAVLGVPSVIIPDELDYLLNPIHPDFESIVIGGPEEFTFDRRLIRQ